MKADKARGYIIQAMIMFVLEIVAYIIMSIFKDNLVIIACVTFILVSYVFVIYYNIKAIQLLKR